MKHLFSNAIATKGTTASLKKMNPVECNETCISRRFRLFIFYTALFFSLIILALIHFTMFAISRRRFKKKTRDYVTRKREFVALSLSDLRQKKEAETSAIRDESGIQNVEGSDDSANDRGQNETLSDQQQSSTTSSQREEKGVATPFEDSTEGSRRRSAVSDALQEPVVVTVATVSAAFAEEMIRRGGKEWDQERRRSSLMDISDIIYSPRKRASQNQTHFSD
ncbi:unnamed protein product [Orchesella dallaii]|uniref:Uncharacterized protein n=1 Tax=Orchesella dallaii TaxID=48710 RepID=A0ABP1R5I8_9HEXA